MNIQCTHPSCPNPVNSFPSLDDNTSLSKVQQRFCTACAMPLILGGRFLPIEKLGAGGFGATFLAQDLHSPTKRHCVLKQLKPINYLEPSQLEKVKRSFKREAEVLEELGACHVQIPTLHAYFELEVRDQSNNLQEFFYLVQEYVDGQDLNKELKQNGRFSEEKVLEVLQQILPVLQFVHKNNSIHRDIKPANIMRHCNGRLYLLDFGAVKQVMSGEFAASTIIFATPGFTPPEQLFGRGASWSTDLYALAVTCLCLLSGENPPPENDHNSNLWKNWRLKARMSPELAAIVDRMLLTAPSERFQSAAEVIAALSQIKVMPKPQPEPPTLPLYIPSFSILGLLFRAALTGSASWLIAIALFSFLGTLWFSTVFWLLILAGLIFRISAQYRPIIEKIYLFIIAVITPLVIFLVFPELQRFKPLQAGLNEMFAVILTALFAWVFAFILMALSQLIYKLSSKVF